MCLSLGHSILLLYGQLVILVTSQFAYQKKSNMTNITIHKIQIPSYQLILYTILLRQYVHSKNMRFIHFWRKWYVTVLSIYWNRIWSSLGINRKTWTKDNTQRLKNSESYSDPIIIFKTYTQKTKQIKRPQNSDF